MNNVIEKMISKSQKALKYAYMPYSKFSVAACILSEKDNLYTGVNVENSSFSLTTCAETAAICAMVSSGDRLIKSMVIIAGTNLLCPPCGACRQRIHEFATADMQIHLCDKSGILRSITINELLPFAFEFKP